MTFSKNSANAKVASESRCRPAAARGSRAARRRAAAIARRSRIATSTDMPCDVDELARANAADGRERRLHERDLARHAGDHDDRTEDDREDHRLCGDVTPARCWRGRRCSSRAGRATTPTTCVARRELAAALAAIGGGRRRIDARERVGELAAVPQAGEKISTRNSTTNGSDGRRFSRGRCWSAGSSTGSAAATPSAEAAHERERDARERRRAPRPRSPRPRAACRRCCDDAARERARGARRPARRRSSTSIHDAMLTPVGVDARELGHARALDDRPHPQPERGVAEQQREPDHGDERDHDRGEVVAVEEHRTERVVHVVAVGDDALSRPYCGGRRTTSSTICGIATSRPSTVTSRAIGGALRR